MINYLISVLIIASVFINYQLPTVEEISEQGFDGWVVTIDPQGLDVLVTNEPETTLQAATNNNALIAINGGGFWSATKPIGNTVVNGKLQNEFIPGVWDKYSPHCFIGFNYAGDLIGGHVKTELKLFDLNPEYGATWGPQLVGEGKPLYYDTEDYRPRAAIGQTESGKYIFMVIDGRSSKSRGASFRQLTDLMIRYGAVNAYNLDGGGSATLIYGGKVMNNPSDGQCRVVATNILVVR